MPFSPMQKQYFREATHRWNVKCGATRSGKTFMDYYLIPTRLHDVRGKDGLAVILGNTKGTLQRNVIAPMQDIFGIVNISDIKSDNTAVIFGEKVYCLGADKITQVDRIRGLSLKYCYGDEVVTWHEDVFNMLKSRLDKPYSKFDGTCNPEGKSHWFKKFLDDESIDVYCQKYTIDDNPFLDPVFVENLKNEYEGTVYYDRYILGKWTNAEGVIYRRFADNPKQFTLDSLDGQDVIFAAIGVDFGGGTSAHAFNCTAFTRGMKKAITVHDYRRTDAATPEELYKDFGGFLEECRAILGEAPVTEVYCDSAEQTLIGGLRVQAMRNKWRINVSNAAKKPINDRIHFYTILQGSGRYAVLKGCRHTTEAFCEALWDDNGTRLDNGSTNIDNLDAQEYSTEPYMKTMLDLGVTNK